MKKLVFLLTAMIFIACNNDTPNVHSADIARKTKYNILCKEKNPYLEWLISDSESFIQYSFSQSPFSTDPEKLLFTRETEDNTIMLNENVGIRIHDSCAIENIGANTVYHIYRDAHLLHTNLFMQDSVSIEIRTGTPIEILRPRGDNCNCIPLCYYEQMEIEWNADLVNQEMNGNGVIVIAEWNGLTNTGQTGDAPIIGIDFVGEDNTCVATLDDNLFEGMPDGALVNLWLIRGNIYYLYYNEEITLPELVEIASYADLDVFARYIQEHPEFMRELRTLTIGSGSVALQPIYLVRNL